MILLEKGRYRARLGEGTEDLAAMRALRSHSFGTYHPDGDAHDDLCQHVLIEDCTGTLLGGFRMLALSGGDQIASSYSARFYDLDGLRGFDGPMVELGRFCIHPDRPDPDILRLAWAALTAHVDATGVTLLFGCSSFAGADPKAHHPALAHLGARHLAPSRWRPGIKAPEVVRFCDLPTPTWTGGITGLPPLPGLYPLPPPKLEFGFAQSAVSVPQAQ